MHVQAWGQTAGRAIGWMQERSGGLGVDPGANREKPRLRAPPGQGQTQTVSFTKRGGPVYAALGSRSSVMWALVKGPSMRNKSQPPGKLHTLNTVTLMERSH